MKIERLSAKDFEEAMDFINMVFSMAHCPFDFAKFLPRLYQPTDEHMSRNLVVRENGRIRGLVGMYPDHVQVGDVVLNLGGIGAVSSHPNDRGKGWMKLLVEKQVEQMKEEHYDISFLIGQRQRYMYFGYEKTGQMLEFKVNKSNIKHYQQQDEATQFSFIRMHAEDVAGIEKAKLLHDMQPVYCIRPEEAFFQYLSTGFMQPWAVLDQTGKMIGYLAANGENKKIVELFVEESASLTCILRSWLVQQNVQEVTIIQPIWAKHVSQCLGNLAEDMQITGSGNWQMFHWDKVISALLSVKGKQQQLMDGSLCIGIMGYGNLHLEVCGNSVNCELTTAQADVQWDALIATRMMFGHVPPSIITSIPKPIQPVLASWFPLPLSWLPQNYV